MNLNATREGCIVMLVSHSFVSAFPHRLLMDCFEWPIPGLFFVYFLSFSNKHYKFYSKSMGNFSSSIQCWDSNSWPSERESPPKTTRMMAKTSICDPKFPRNFILRKSVDTSLSTLRTCHLNVEQQVVSRFWLKLKEWMRQSQLTTFSQIVI